MEPMVEKVKMVEMEVVENMRKMVKVNNYTNMN